MSRLSDFVGSPKEVDVRGKKLTIYPLKVKDLKMFRENMSDEEKLDLSKKIIMKSLNDPSITDEELDNMDVEVSMILLKEILTLNGLEDDKLGAIKERLGQKGPK